MTYKIGDVVRLKSGGVPMCVTAYHPCGFGTTSSGMGTVSVTWLTTAGEPKSYAFDERLVDLSLSPIAPGWDPNQEQYSTWMMRQIENGRPA